MFTIVAVASLMLPPGAVEAPAEAPARRDPQDGTEVSLSVPAREPELSTGLRGYLRRPVPASARFLDHGVIELGVAGGFPHVYRVGLGVGVLDHLTLGVTAHWLAGQSVPGVAPEVGVAFFRARWWEVGARYTTVLHAPDQATSAVSPVTHYVLGTAAMQQAWLTAGFDAGLVHRRRARLEGGGFRTSTEFGGGPYLRLGSRRLGLTAQATWPELVVELKLDIRFDAFEARPPGGWWVSGTGRRGRAARRR